MGEKKKVQIDYYPDSSFQHAFFKIGKRQYIGLPTEILKEYLDSNFKELEKFRGKKASGRKKKLSDFDIKQIEELIKKGYSKRRIANMYEVSHGTIINALRNAKHELISADHLVRD